MRTEPFSGTFPPLQKHCDRQKANLRIRFKPSLFQHVGTHSSLAGKIQKLKVGWGLNLGLGKAFGGGANGGEI